MASVEKLESHYGKLLAAGFLVLRQAVHADDLEWAEAELELLHNIPSLLCEPNLERHRTYYEPL
jgi:hypothetical protein